jgi:hypothetical protein
MVETARPEWMGMNVSCIGLAYTGGCQQVKFP